MDRLRNFNLGDSFICSGRLAGNRFRRSLISRRLESVGDHATGFGPAPYHGEIGLSRLAQFELLSQIGLRLLLQCQHHHTRDRTIQSMHRVHHFAC